jgi:mono/diheme cytochrome c family protein
VVAVCLAVGAAGAGCGSSPGTATTSSTRASTTAGGDAAAGKSLFASAACGGCHKLKAAGAEGTVGPSLDQSRTTLALVVDVIANGKGTMPSFAGQLTEQQIQDVAVFVVSSRS